jgi:hypothetical protein
LAGQLTGGLIRRGRKSSPSWQRAITAGLLWLIAAGLACGAYGCAAGRDPRQLSDSDCSRFTSTTDGVSIAIDPWTRSADLRNLFRHAPDKPMLALRLVVANHGKTTIRLSDTACQLVDETGQCLPVLSRGEVNARLFDDGGGTAMFIIIATGGYGGGIGAAVMAVNDAENHHDQKMTREQSMELVLVDPGQVLSGFVFFDDASTGILRRKDPAHLTLHIRRVLRGENLPPLAFSIPCSVDK